MNYGDEIVTFGHFILRRYNERLSTFFFIFPERREDDEKLEILCSTLCRNEFWFLSSYSTRF